MLPNVVRMIMVYNNTIYLVDNIYFGNIRPPCGVALRMKSLVVSNTVEYGLQPGGNGQLAQLTSYK